MIEKYINIEIKLSEGTKLTTLQKQYNSTDYLKINSPGTLEGKAVSGHTIDRLLVKNTTMELSRRAGVAIVKDSGQNYTFLEEITDIEFKK